MLYNLNEKYGCSIKFGDNDMALMVTEEEGKDIIRKGLPYAIEHGYGVFMDAKGKELDKDDVTEEIVNKGFYVKDCKEVITYETVLEDLIGYLMLHQNLLFMPDEGHMPKQPKPHVVYSMVNWREWTARNAAEVIEMGY